MTAPNTIIINLTDAKQALPFPGYDELLRLIGIVQAWRQAQSRAAALSFDDDTPLVCSRDQSGDTTCESCQ